MQPKYLRLHVLHLEYQLEQIDDQQVRRVIDVEKPLGNFQIGLGVYVNERQRQQSEDFKSNGMAADFQGQRVFHVPVQGGQIAQGVNQGPQPGLVSAKIENHHQNQTRGGVVKVDKAQQQNAAHKQPPLPLLKSPGGQQAHNQRKVNVQVQQIAPKVLCIERKNPEGLGNQGKDAESQQVFLNVPGIEHSHGQAVAEQGKGHPADPPKHRILREERIADMVNGHGNNGDEF